jgi:hypothetical protein
MQRPNQREARVPLRSANDKRPYTFQAFPAAMHHEDGRTFVVHSEEDAIERCPESEGWQSKPFPAKPVVKPVAELTLVELKAKLAVDIDEHQKLKVVCAEQIACIIDLQEKLVDLQTKLANKPKPEPAVPSEVKQEDKKFSKRV